MAIIATYTTKNGTVVRIHDDYMAKRGTPEYEAVCEEQRRVAYRILVNAAMREEWRDKE